MSAIVRRNTSSWSPAAPDSTAPSTARGLDGERGAEQHPVDDGVFVALFEPRPNVAVVNSDPSWPCGFKLIRAKRVQLGRKLASQLGHGRAGFAEAHEPRRRDGGRSGPTRPY
jgi:hypothetical protein